MKILVVGGNGLIGGHAALRLKSKGHDVTIGSRKAPAPGTPLGELPFMALDYTAESQSELGNFETIIFAAGNDVRHVPKGTPMDDHVVQANTVAIPRFFAAAKKAGVRRAINIGSFYPQAAPHLLADNAYMRSRRDSDVGLRKLADDKFFAVSLNAPVVQGLVPGLPSRAESFMRFAEGKLDLPPEVPPGGVNYISTDSISDAVETTLTRGTNGTAYLIGDENLTFQQFFGAFFEAIGKPLPKVVDKPFALLPPSAVAWGHGKTLFYEPDAAETKELGYRRNDVLRTVRELMVPAFHK